MEVSTNVALGVMKSIQQLYSNQDLETDFVIEIDQTEIKCHRFILASCSGFFSGLFRSGMKEATSGRVTLPGISCETFQLILKTLYTGCDVITEDNVISLWHAVNQLQIGFMFDLCVDVVMEMLSLENFEEVYKNAKVMNSEKVLCVLGQFMSNNFVLLRNTITFLELSYDELFKLISADKLVVECEDQVLELIMKWIEHSDGERVSKLIPLLNVTRTCLVSVSYLNRLYRHALIYGNSKAKDIIYNAVLYHTEGHSNGTWTKAALQRESSKFGNYGVYCYSTGKFEAYSVIENKMFDLPACPECSMSVHLVVFDNELYACGRGSKTVRNCKLFVFRENDWRKVTELKGSQLFLLSYEKIILVLNSSRKSLSSIIPNESYKLQEDWATLPENGTFEYAMIYCSQLLVFYSLNVNDIEEIAVHCFDLINKSWKRLDHIDGPARYMISFKDGANHYIVQRDGNVWKLDIKSDTFVEFRSIGKLWTFNRVLCGAVHYRDHLTLFGDHPDHYSDDTEFNLTDFPYHIMNWGNDNQRSNFLPVVLAKSCLMEKEQ